MWEAAGINNLQHSAKQTEGILACKLILFLSCTLHSRGATNQCLRNVSTNQRWIGQTCKLIQEMTRENIMKKDNDRNRLSNRDAISSVRGISKLPANRSIPFNRKRSACCCPSQFIVRLPCNTGRGQTSALDAINSYSWSWDTQRRADKEKTGDTLRIANSLSWDMPIQADKEQTGDTAKKSRQSELRNAKRTDKKTGDMQRRA